ncbi:MAG: dienelactone hydrolase family protein [Gammaproteobacteria bacterium]|jgi:carboxymethylenebutenolidase|nr:dienelactone hydrolase family protein [Gammaproteobacteria bacterium]
MGKNITLTAAQGFSLGAYVAQPQGTPKGAVVVVQEIFGVNQHIRQVADGYAAQGYYAVAPKLFDRIEADIELGYDAQDMGRGIELAFQQLDHALALADLQATITAAAAHGNVGVVGYCFGGLMTWLSACQLDGVSAVSSYYGGGVAAHMDKSPKCPVMMHFGELDAHIPMADVETVRASLPDSQIYVYAADHGFNCDHRDSFNADAAELAQARTLAHFAKFIAV